MNGEEHELESLEESRLSEERTRASDAALEFETAEELIRHDAARTAPPARLASRLMASTRARARPWWKSLFSR